MITNYDTAKSQVNNEVDGYISDLSIKGIADGIEKVYKYKGFIEKLAENCRNTKYGNSYELAKLYKIIKE